MKKYFTILAALAMAMSITACSGAAAEQNPATAPETGTVADTTSETAASAAQTTIQTAANTEIDREHAEKLTNWLDGCYTRDVNSAAESLENSISRALKQVQDPEKLDGEYHNTLPDEILEATKSFCRWYEDKAIMSDFAVRIKNGEVSAVWTERNVCDDLKERLKNLKESSRNWQDEYCSEGELWSYMGFDDYDAYISILENWGTTTYYGSYPKPTASRYDTAEEEFSDYSDTKPDLEKIGS